MDELILSYERMISSIVDTLVYSSLRVSYEELMQVGRLSIWKNIGKYDPEKGKESSFLYICIKRDMWRYLDEAGKHTHTSLDSIFEQESDEDITRSVEQKMLIEKLYDKFGENAVYFVERFIHGNTIIDITEHYGVPKKKVSYWSNKILNYTKEENYEE